LKVENTIKDPRPMNNAVRFLEGLGLVG